MRKHTFITQRDNQSINRAAGLYWGNCGWGPRCDAIEYPNDIAAFDAVLDLVGRNVFTLEEVTIVTFNVITSTDKG